VETRFFQKEHVGFFSYSTGRMRSKSAMNRRY